MKHLIILLLVIVSSCSNNTSFEEKYRIKNEAIDKQKADSIAKIERALAIEDSVMLSKLSPKKRGILLAKREKERIEKENAALEASMSGNDKALREIKKEKKVYEAIITDANVLYVSVADDGTRRDGFADYLCALLNENNASCNWVKVVKVNSLKDPNRDNAYGVLLGESKCD